MFSRNNKQHQATARNRLKIGAMFDAKSFIRDNFQTAANLVARMKSHGLDAPKVAAVEKWFQRGRIPGDHLPALLCVVELENGRPASIAGYMSTGGRGHVD